MFYVTSVWGRGGGEVSYFNDCADQNTEHSSALVLVQNLHAGPPIEDHNCLEKFDVLLHFPQSVFLPSF